MTIASVSLELASVAVCVAEEVKLVVQRRDWDEVTLLATRVPPVALPIACLLFERAIQRAQEFGADAHGAWLIGDPALMAVVLKKMEAKLHGLPKSECLGISTLPIVIPANLLLTHAPTDERVARLEAMAREAAGNRL